MTLVKTRRSRYSKAEKRAIEQEFDRMALQSKRYQDQEMFDEDSDASSQSSGSEDSFVNHLDLVGKRR
jgi:hypothetical protein